MEPADAGKADTVDPDLFVAMDQRDVRPAAHFRLDQIGGFGVVGAQERQGLVGEHDTEAPGCISRVLFVDADLEGRLQPADENGRIKAGRAAADNGNVHGSLPRPVTWNCSAE